MADIEVTLDSPAAIEAELSPSAAIEVTVIGSGPRGATGPQGETGPAGEKGSTGDPGPAGSDGKDGRDGVSPTVTVTEITGGHRVSVSDTAGTKTFDVMDGAKGETGSSGPPGETGPAGKDGSDGAPGKDGKDGQDGVSPEVTVATITGGHSVTITDADHPGGQTFNVMDGTGAVDSVNGKTGAVVLSASDVGAGTYSKPSGGIPKTDLASAVQTSLGKADTALQSYTETDPTVPSWAKASGKPSYTASEVGAIAAPSSPATGAFLVWNGSAWVGQTLSTWQGGSY